MSGAEHPLHRILVEAAAGRPPAPDGSITVLPPLEGPVDAVCSFPAHNVLAIDLPREELLAQLDPKDLGAPMNASFLAWVAGRWEMAYEVDPSARDRGMGRALAAVAPSLVPDGEPLFAQASPGNAASVRSLVAAGYPPIGGECLFERTA